MPRCVIGKAKVAVRALCAFERVGSECVWYDEAEEVVRVVDVGVGVGRAGFGCWKDQAVPITGTGGAGSGS